MRTLMAFRPFPVRRKEIMRYIKPDFYDKFTCIADKCPATCCAGWQIVIDEDSLEKYGELKGAFGKRLRNSIDWEEGTFYQFEGRCAFLNNKNFCDIQCELGEEGLCETCHRYPRHIEEYEGLREYSLSLSCPQAARIMLEKTDAISFVEWEDELEDDFEEFDFLLFSQLEEAREVMFQIIQDRSLDLEIRMEILLQFADDMQQCVDEERYFDMDEVIETYREWKNVKVQKMDAKRRYEQRIKEFAVFFKLELLQDDWEEVLSQTWNVLFEKGQDSYRKICERFQKMYLVKEKNAWEIAGEQLLMFFVYTYFCGAVYDDMIYSKMALSIFSVRWIREFFMAQWVSTFSMSGKKIGKEELISMAYRYAREIEHSDLNLNALEDWFNEE